MKNKSNLKLFTVKLIASDKKKIKIGAFYTQKKRKDEVWWGKTAKLKNKKNKKLINYQTMYVSRTNNIKAVP